MTTQNSELREKYTPSVYIKLVNEFWNDVIKNAEELKRYGQTKQ